MSESKKEKKEEKSLEEKEVRGKVLNKIGLIILIILLCACSFGFGFGTNFKLVKNTSNATSNQKNSKTSATSNEKTLTDPNGTTECSYEGESLDYLDVTDSLVQETAKKLDYALTKYCGVWDEYTDGIYTTANLDENLAFEIAMRTIYSEKDLKFTEGTEISKNDFYSALRRIFGSSYADKYDAYSDHNGCPGYTYDSSKEAFIQQPSACGGTCGPYNQKKIVKAIKSDNALIIYERVVFIENKSSAIKYYKDVNKTSDITSSLKLSNDGLFEQVDSNYNFGSLYKLTFAYEDGNYVFASSEYLG